MNKKQVLRELNILLGNFDNWHRPPWSVNFKHKTLSLEIRDTHDEHKIVWDGALEFSRWEKFFYLPNLNKMKRALLERMVQQQEDDRKVSLKPLYNRFAQLAENRKLP